MHRELALVWRDIDADADIRAVLVRGAGANFSSGGDYALIERMIADEATLLRVWKEASDLVYNIVNCSKPVVAAVRGVAVGAGLAIALLADVSIAATDAKILDGHTRLGVAAGDHAVMIWPLLCGLAKARYHLLTNKPLSGAEAERIGLIARSVSDDAGTAGSVGGLSRTRRGQRQRDPVYEARAQQLAAARRPELSTPRWPLSFLASDSATRARASMRCAASADPNSRGLRPSHFAPCLVWAAQSRRRP